MLAHISDGFTVFRYLGSNFSTFCFGKLLRLPIAGS